MLGPEDNPFDLYGHIQVKVEVKGLFSSVHVSAPGHIYFKSAEGHIYYFECANFDLEGVMGTDKVLCAVGSVRIFDLTNKLVSVIHFDAHKDARNGMITSLFLGSGDAIDPLTGVSPHRKDLVRIDIHQLLIENEKSTDFKDISKQGPLLARGHGSYLEKIQYEGDDKPLWTINDKFSLKKVFV